MAPEALYNLAVSLRRLDQPQKAIECLSDLVKRFPKHALVDDALLKIGQVYEDDLREYEKALAAYQRVLRLRTGNFGANVEQEVFRRGGRVRMQQRQFKEANTFYNQAVDNARRLQVDDANYITNDANIRAEFITRNNDFEFKPLALYFDARDRFRLGDYEGCRKKLEELKGQYPAARIADEAAMLTADAWRKEGRLAKANAAYEALRATWPDSPHATSAWFRIGEFYRLIGRSTEARAAYGKAIEAAKSAATASNRFLSNLAAKRLEEITEQAEAMRSLSY